jgi:hypothetical protein
VGLLDVEGRVTQSAWQRFYESAVERSERRSQAGRNAGLASGKARKRGTTVQQTSSGRRTDVERPGTIRNLTSETSSIEDVNGAAGSRGGAAPAAPLPPARPPVFMGRLDEAPTNAIEAMLHDLAQADGRRRRLEAELAARQAADTQVGARPDLRAVAEATFSDLGGTWTPPAQSELPS